MYFAKKKEEEGRFEVKDVEFYKRPWTYLLCEKVPEVSKCLWMDLRQGLILVSTLYLTWGVIILCLSAWFHDRLEKEFHDYNLSLTLAILTYVVAFIEILLALFLMYVIPFGALTPHMLIFQWIKAIVILLYFASSVVGFCFTWEAGLTYLVAFFFSAYIWICTNSVYKLRESFSKSSKRNSLQSDMTVVSM